MPGIDGGTVCIFGAGGPVGAAVAPVLAEHFTLRLVDIQPVEQVLAKPPDPIWPRWREAPQPPHEWRQADITDYAQVASALDGCDAAINLAVNRSAPERAFRINAVGAYHVLQAAAKLRPSRVIHTGMINAWGYDYEGTTRTVDNFVRRLRVKLEADPRRPRHLVTVRGGGYRFDP